ncbi:MAG: class I SAM-dependent methyltransferase [Ignavibacteriae bacterium]|nr:MAG: class I SAM-dependent methyltransferase [Ignavibacteriota bacterium]
MNKEFSTEIRKTFFPLSSKYDENWILKNSLGENILYNLESLCEVLEYKPGMKVLDLGCGKAISAIFLANEFKVQVWAVDSFISPSENYKRIKEQSCGNQVFPLKLDARNLPFPKDFFDIIIAADSYMYFGTDEKYTPYLSQFLKPHGFLGIVDICFTKEINYLADAPEYLKPHYQDKWYYVHSLGWWEKFIEKTGLLNIVRAEILPQNDFIRAEYVKDMKKRKKQDEIANILAKDQENLIAMFRLTAERTEKPVKLDLYSKQL